jgi:uncharacterized integral membrane protein
MFRKIVAWLILVFAILIAAGAAYRYETFTWKAPLAVAAVLAGIVGAIGLLRGWPYAHQLVGAFPLVIAGLSVWNAVEMNMLVGRSIFSTVYMLGAALLGLALVIADYRMAQTQRPAADQSTASRLHGAG